MPVKLPTYIPLTEAARRYGMSQEALTRAVADGIMRAVRTPDGRVLVASEDVAVVTKEQFSHLQGQGISIRGASRKYDVPVSTLRSWARQGHIKILTPPAERRQGRVILLDEQDVAYCATVYHQLKQARGQVAGMRIFAS